MDKKIAVALDTFKNDIDSLCENHSAPCTKGDLLEAMKRLNELILTLVDK